MTGAARPVNSGPGEILRPGSPLRRQNTSLNHFVQSRCMPLEWVDAVRTFYLIAYCGRRAHAATEADLWADQSVSNSRRLDALPNPGDAPVPKGSVLTIAFELDGQKFTALNGGPAFKFTEASSFTVRCDSQQEVDEYWTKLSAGGSEGSNAPLSNEDV